MEYIVMCSGNAGCNECEDLIDAIQRYRQRNGFYPERVLVDKIYRNRKNLSFCKENGIQISGPALGRPKKDPRKDKKQERRDGVDRIEIERRFRLAKRCYGLGLIKTKLDKTTRSSIALSITAMNVDRLVLISLLEFLESIFQGTIPDILYYLGYENGIEPYQAEMLGC